jgi:hypothetical protein
LTTTIRAARRARDEARFVRTKLAEAIAWCKSRGEEDEVRKGSYLSLFKGASFVHGLPLRAYEQALLTSSEGRERPAFGGTPPSLFELPSPLPIALPADNYNLTVERNGIMDPPPEYKREISHGEKTIERTEMDEYERDHAELSSSSSSNSSIFLRD